MMHDHGPALSPDAASPEADTCPFTLVGLPCGCQDVRYACGYVDREHDHIYCPGPPPGLTSGLSPGNVLGMTKAEKVREARLRRVLARRGFALSRNRVRDPGAIGYGTYSIRENATGIAVETGLRLDLAEYWVTEYDTSRADQEARTWP